MRLCAILNQDALRASVKARQRAFICREGRNSGEMFKVLHKRLCDETLTNMNNLVKPLFTTLIACFCAAAQTCKSSFRIDTPDECLVEEKL
jgi:hypothetical protein